MARVMVLMSGGVDSSVAAALLRDEGHVVTGVTLKLWGGASDSGCCSAADIEDARRVAAQLGIPHYVFNFGDDFERAVVGPYAAGYAAGRTPNPCVACNETMKWGRALARARQLGFDAVATGHHARLVADPSGAPGCPPRLARGADRAKDQSYVLATLPPEVLAHTLLPVGTLTKAQVREHAARLGLRTAAKAESMDVCFITRGGREAFLGERVPVRPGAVVDGAGQVLGAHDGVHRFTIGQRRGIGVAAGERRYVVDLDVPTATVVLGGRDDLLSDGIPLTALRWHGPGREGGDVGVQVRAHGAPVAGRVVGERVALSVPQPRVAPGQVVAFYDGDIVAGAAVAA